MNRREFLAAAGALAYGAVPRMVDTHTHFYDPSRPQGVPWPRKSESSLYRTFLPKHLKEVARPLGVTGVVAIEASPWIEDNQWVLDQAENDPFVLGLVGHLPPGRPEFAAQLKRFHRNPLFLGIRIAGSMCRRAVEDPASAADYERLMDAGLQVDVLNVGGVLDDLARFADRFPRLRVVIDHMPLERSEAAAMRALRGRPLVYAKVSWIIRRVEGRVPLEMSYYKEMLDEVWDVFGPDRVLYGSNWPVSEQFAPYRDVLRIASEYVAGRGADAMERFFWKNAQAAYRWPARPQREDA